jgi:hypothetical protein
VLLLAGHEVVGRVAVDEVEGDDDRGESEEDAEPEPELVEGDAAVGGP